MSIAHIAESALSATNNGALFVVITGGEPLHNNLESLTELLLSLNIRVHLETSGVNQLSGSFDWITLSPKPHKPPTQEVLAACHELKVVVHGSEDLAFAEAMANAACVNRKHQSTDPPALLLQPGHDCIEGQQLAIEFVKAHPQWRLSLQIHKLLGVR